MVVNLLHICEIMTGRWVDESEIRVPIETFKRFAERNNFTVEKKLKGDTYKYKLSRVKIPIYFISGSDQKEFRFMDIADVHIGNAHFDEKALRNKLRYAVYSGVNQVFIAGDLFEGICNDNCEITYSSQIEYAFNIFKDYPLHYYAINGNHDYSFEQRSLPNPIKTLSIRLKEIGINFEYFDTYLMDFIICGVIKRVMHVERQDFSKKSIFATLKLKQFDEDGMLLNTYEGNTYPVRFFQVGHIHVNVQMYYSKRKVFISQSGSFIETDRSSDCANVISGNVIDQKVLMD